MIVTTTLSQLPSMRYHQSSLRVVYNLIPSVVLKYFRKYYLALIKMNMNEGMNDTIGKNHYIYNYIRKNQEPYGGVCLSQGIHLKILSQITRIKRSCILDMMSILTHINRQYKSTPPFPPLQKESLILSYTCSMSHNLQLNACSEFFTTRN